MSKQINKIKKAKVKQGLLKGKSYKQALLDAGYSEATAGHNVSPYNSLLKAVTEEIEQEFKMSDVTVESVLKEINLIRRLAEEKGDLSTAGRMAELKGKYLSMFSDKLKLQNDLPQEDEQSINQRRSRLINMVRDTYNNKN